MFKKAIYLIFAAILSCFLLLLGGCKTINRTHLTYESLENMQTALPNLYYFDFEKAFDDLSSKTDISFQLESVEYRSEAIVITYIGAIEYQNYGYQATYNVISNTQTMRLTISAYEHNNHDFVVTDERISREYDAIADSKNFREERIIDDIRCMIYGNLVAFFWVDEQQYTISINRSANQDEFTIGDFITVVEFSVINRYRTN